MSAGPASPPPAAVASFEDAAFARLAIAGSAVADQPGETRRYGAQTDQCYEVFGPLGGPRIVLVHGGFFRPSIDRTHARAMARALATGRRRVVLAEYRRAPGRPEATIEDVGLLDAALRQDGEPAVVGWVGHSAGGTLVLLRALDSRLPAVPVVALAPVADLRAAAAQELGSGAIVDWIGAAPPAAPQQYDALDPRAAVERVRRDAGLAGRLDDVHIVHGERDATVPVEISEPLRLRTTRLPDAHHIDLIDPESPSWASVRRIIDEVCGSAPLSR